MPRSAATRGGFGADGAGRVGLVVGKGCGRALVLVRREGTFVFYTLADDHIGELVTQALSHAGHRTGRREPAGAVPRVRGAP